MELLKLFLTNILRLSAWFAILVVIFVPLEQLFAIRAHRPLRKGIGIDMCYYFLNGLLPAAILSIPAALLAWSVRHIVPGSLLAFTALLRFRYRIPAAFLAGEIGYYWGHRWSHEIPFLWRFHAIHHSAEEVDFLVNSRSHPLDMVFSHFCMLVPMYVLGFAEPKAGTSSAIPVIVPLVGIVWGFVIHANIRMRLGLLEWFVSSPMFHHWHHTKTGPIDHNYASTFPWLDRLFGTHILPNEWPESYGIEAKLPNQLIDQLAYPLLPEEMPAAEKPVNAAETSE